MRICFITAYDTYYANYLMCACDTQCAYNIIIDCDTHTSDCITVACDTQGANSFIIARTFKMPIIQFVLAVHKMFIVTVL